MVTRPEPTEVLLTRHRIIQASHICRWNGRVWRHYSILEHTNIGALVLRELGYDHNAVKSFLLHDLEETEFCGDIPTPDKAIYMNADYFRDVREWDTRLHVECEVEVDLDAVRMMDEIMVRAEYTTVSRRVDDAPRTDANIRLARVLIDAGTYGTPELWWQLWDNSAPVLGFGGVL